MSEAAGASPARTSDGVAFTTLLPSGWAEEQLTRLQRLVRLQQLHADHLNENGRLLIQRAIFATYVDCRDLGALQAATSVLAETITTPPRS